ncbi:RNA polymerase sigma factor [Neptunicella sp. SCSIO 80796]|uniref:RNA polymerase sigma factor n=1 Tax=Neptunicella plasticusilytica TaxID=3117012 RepID=UPI003A4E0398
MKVIYLNKTVSPSTEPAQNSQLIEQLYAEYGSALRRFIRVRSRLNDNDCDDVMQEVYERLLKLDNLQEKLAGRMDTVRNYLFQIATHLLIDLDRRAKVRCSDAHISEQDAVIFSSLYSPERELQNRKQLSQIEQALTDIKTVHKQAFILNRIDGRSYREISDVLGVSVSTVEKYISAALVAIRERMLAE